MPPDSSPRWWFPTLGSSFLPHGRFAGNIIGPLHALILGIALLPYFLNLGGSSLWDSNESFYAETPREMLQTGDYVIPRFNYYFRWQKPPLAYWAVAASYALFGVSEWAARLPIALAAAAWILLCYWAGRRWLDRYAALLAALIMAVNLRIFVMSQRAITEIWLGLFISLALVLFGLILLERPKRDMLLSAAAYAALGLGVMTKGPVALVLAAGVIGIYLIQQRNVRLVPRLKPLLGGIILVLIILPWYWRVVGIVGWEPLRHFFLSDNLGRYLSEEYGPYRGPQYYLNVLLGDFFPWSILGLAALLQRPWRLPKDSGRRGILLWLLVWAATILVFFSLSRNKQEYYVLPLYFPLSMLLAHALTSFGKLEGWPWRILQWAFFICGGLLLLLGLCGAFLMRNMLPAVPAWQANALGLVLGVGGIGTCLFAGRARWQKSLFLLFPVCWIGVLSLPLWLLPQWEVYRPVREFARIILSRRQPGDYAGYYKYSAPSLAYYLREPIFEMIWENQIVYFLSTSRRRTFCIIQQDHFEAIRPRLSQPYHVVAMRPIIGFQARNLWHPLDPASMPQLLLICNSP